jgi:hypothetical protein
MKTPDKRVGYTPTPPGPGYGETGAPIKGDEFRQLHGESFKPEPPNKADIVITVYPGGDSVKPYGES